MLAKAEFFRFKNYERKIKSPFMIYAYFESIILPDDNGKENPKRMSLIRTNTENMLLPDMAINYYVLVINLVSFFSHI